ncbi:hypothetical protein [Candidatus Uabimicrobium sp. HlEnr_7]|uniref:hypothetical protein n=1 Tax=Candidatus Uabimicrobium helgolandensis TaxID=3095367 RepID=UPI0035593286
MLYLFLFFLLTTLGGISYYFYTLTNNQEFLQSKFHQTIKNFFPGTSQFFDTPKNITFDLSQKLLVLKDVHIRDSDNETLLNISILKIKFSSLIKQSIANVTIIKPQIFIKKYKSKYNFSHFFINPPTPNQTPKKDTKLPPIIIKDGEISYRNHLLLQEKINFSGIDFSGSLQKNQYDFSLNGTCNLLETPLIFNGKYTEDDFFIKSDDLKLDFSSLDKVLIAWPKELEAKGQVTAKNILFTKKNGLKTDVNINCKSVYFRKGVYKSYPITNLKVSSPFSKDGFTDINFYCDFMQESVISKGGKWGKDHGYLSLMTKNIVVNNKWLDKHRALHPLVEKIASIGKIDTRLKSSFILTKLPESQLNWKLLCDINQGTFIYENKQPLAVENIDLQVEVNKEAINLLKGNWDFCDGEFNIDPRGKFFWHEERFSNVNIEFKDINLTRKVWDAMPLGDQIWKFSQAEGNISGRITFPKKWNESISQNLNFPVHYIPRIDVYVKDVRAVPWEAPVPVDNINGHIFFENGILYLNDLTCKSQGHKGDGKITGKIWLAVKPEPCFSLQIKCRQCEVHPGIYRSFLGKRRDWHEVICEVWEQIDPKGGTIDIDITVDKKIGSGTEDADVHVRIESFDAAIAYKNFYYPVKDVNGVVIIDIEQENIKVDIQNFTARNVEGTFKIDGVLVPQKVNGKTEIGLDLKVLGNNALLNEDLRDALDEKSKKIWRQLSPEGHIDAIVEVHKSPYQEKVDWEANIDLNQVRILHENFCYPVEEIMGTIKIIPNKFYLKNARGLSVNDTRVTVDGIVENEMYQFKISIDDYPIEKKVFDYIPQGKNIRDLFQVKGKIDLDISLEGQKEKLDWEAKVVLDHMSGHYQKFPYHFDDVYGSILINSGGIKIDNCYLRRKEMTTRLQGYVKQNDYQLSMSGNHLIVDKDLYQCYPEEVKSALSDFAMKGIVDFQLIIRPGETPFHLIVFPKNLDFIYRDFPYHLKDLHSKSNAPIEVDTNTIKINNLVSKTPHGDININGVVDILKDNKTIVDIKCHAENLQIDKLLYRALKPYIKEFLDSFKPKGVIKNIDFNIFYKEENKQPYLRYQADNILLQSVMDSSSFLRKLSGDFSCSGFTFEGKNTMEGKYKNGDLQLDSIHLKDLNGDIKFFNQYLSLKPKAKMYDGNIHGELLMDTSSYGGYKGSFAIDKVRLAPLVSDIKKEKKVDVSGLLSGFFKFEGTNYNSEELTGSGKIDVKNGNLWEFPIFLAIFDLFALPSKPSFREGSMKFSFSPKAIQILSLQLSSSLLSISGNGSIKNDRCNIRLRTNLAPKIIPRIPIVTDMIDYIKDGVMGLSLTGTVQNPSVSFLHWKEFQKIISGSKDK